MSQHRGQTFNYRFCKRKDDKCPLLCNLLKQCFCTCSALQVNLILVEAALIAVAQAYPRLALRMMVV